MGSARPLKLRDIESLDCKRAIQHNWARIYSKVIVTERGCWEYQQNKDVPELLHNGKRVPVYRISYLVCKGDIPSGLYVCHQCDNPKCCNPMHLWLGTPQQNSMDRAEKGRVPDHYKTSWQRTLERDVEPINLPEKPNQKKIVEMDQPEQEETDPQELLFDAIKKFPGLIGDDLIQLLWIKTTVEGECWIYPYHRVRWMEAQTTAQRLVYSLTGGPIPIDKTVGTVCGNANCINPYHLWLDDIHRGPKTNQSTNRISYNPEIQE